MTLQQLKYALQLQKSGSFKLASQKLKISQPALSIQIQKLEDELDISLFDRSANPIEPTDEGRLFLIRAEELIINASDLMNYSSELREKNLW